MLVLIIINKVTVDSLQNVSFVLQRLVGSRGVQRRGFDVAFHGRHQIIRRRYQLEMLQANHDGEYGSRRQARLLFRQSQRCLYQKG